ncbi:MAG: hypothetical protein HRS50_00905 [Mycoplasmataceae bacterium]|nr:hypothetical protein [Mycoplasmataceae bacterium]
MENKYYIEIRNKIELFIIKNEYEKALKVINEELSMPYIPIEFEKFLLESLNNIPINDKKSVFNLSLEKILDLLIKLDKSNKDFSELIQHLSKFNLKNEKDELEYYFSKSENKRNRAMIFELLIKEKVDMECEYGNPTKVEPVTESISYLADKEKLKNRLDKIPTLIEPSYRLLDEIYLTKHLGQNLDNEYIDMILFTLSRIFKDDELVNGIDNYDEIKLKIQNFKSFDNL